MGEVIRGGAPIAKRIFLDAEEFLAEIVSSNGIFYAPRRRVLKEDEWRSNTVQTFAPMWVILPLELKSGIHTTYSSFDMREKSNSWYMIHATPAPEIFAA